MALIEKNIDWSQLVTFTPNGLKIPDFVTIKESLIQLFKSVYGSDIDVSTGTADGIYIDNISLLINNLLQSFKNFYAQLDVTTAYGKYLENLCSLSNVVRKSATYSNVYLVCTASEDITINQSELPLKFLDDEGNTWSYSDEIEFKANEPQSILVTCDTMGPVRAKKGSINKLVNTNMVLNIVQENDANVGSYAETDSQLRARRNQYLGNYGSTVIESLANSLLSITGLEDVKIYNNNSGDDIEALDGTDVMSRSVYIIIRKRANINIDDSVIGSIIYQRMTPGILTTVTKDSVYGISKTYKYPSLITDISQEVNWKEAKPDNPTITIQITPLNNFASADNNTLDNISQKVINYINELPLESDIKIYNLINTVLNSDLKFRGTNTFTLSYEDIKINDINSDYKNKGTYFEYNIENVEYSDSDSKKIITIK